MKKLIWVIIILGIVFAIYHFTRPKEIALIPEEGQEEEVTAAQPKAMCYLKETKGQEGSDYQFVSVVYEKDGSVSGVMNWLPAEKDSLVGHYTGSVGPSTNADHPSQLSVLYVSEGEGILFKQEEILLVGTKDVIQMIGDKFQDTDGVFRFKDKTKLSPGQIIPLADCATVPDRLAKDYLEK